MNYHDGENVLRSAFVIEPACRVDDSAVGVDAEQAQAAGVNAALKAKGQAVALVAVRRQHLNHFGIRRRVLGDGDVISGLGKNGRVVVVVHNGNVDLRKHTRRDELQTFNVWKPLCQETLTWARKCGMQEIGFL